MRLAFVSDDGVDERESPPLISVGSVDVGAGGEECRAGVDFGVVPLWRDFFDCASLLVSDMSFFNESSVEVADRCAESSVEVADRCADEEVASVASVETDWAASGGVGANSISELEDRTSLPLR